MVSGSRLYSKGKTYWILMVNDVTSLRLPSPGTYTLENYKKKSFSKDLPDPLYKDSGQKLHTDFKPNVESIVALC